MGDGTEGWGEFPARIAEITQVVTYDRAGLGASELGPEPRDAVHVARDLDALLRGLDLQGPFVLIGHSLGGLCIRVFADLFPEAVAGLVFLDPTTEGMHLSLATEEGRRQAQEQLVQYPEGVQAEGRAVFASLEQLRALESSPDVPVLVVSGMKPPAIPPDTPDEQLEAMRAAGLTLEKWRELQQRKYDEHVILAARFPQGLHVSADESQHYIHLDQPELVAELIAELIETVRASTTEPGPSESESPD